MSFSIQDYAIQTRYLRETARLGSRIKATVSHMGSITIPFPEALHGDEGDRAAVRALVVKFLPPEYHGREFVSAMLPDGSMSHIFLSATPFFGKG